MFNDKYGLTKAVLEGRKTMTRRMIAAPKTWHGIDVYGFSVNKDNLGNVKDISLVGADGGCIEDVIGNLGMILPKYNIGEVVAVAQSYNEIYEELKRTLGSSSSVTRNFFHKYIQGGRMPVSNKMFVKAEAMLNRIRITDIKVERLQEISDEDCMKEGIIRTNIAYTVGDYLLWDDRLRQRGFDTPCKAFAVLIDNVSGKGTWDSNPYVFVYEFELVK